MTQPAPRTHDICTACFGLLPDALRVDGATGRAGVTVFPCDACGEHVPYGQLHLVGQAALDALKPPAPPAPPRTACARRPRHCEECRDLCNGCFRRLGPFEEITVGRLSVAPVPCDLCDSVTPVRSMHLVHGATGLPPQPPRAAPRRDPDGDSARDICNGCFRRLGPMEEKTLGRPHGIPTACDLCGNVVPSETLHRVHERAPFPPPPPPLAGDDS